MAHLDFWETRELRASREIKEIAVHREPRRRIMCRSSAIKVRSVSLAIVVRRERKVTWVMKVRTDCVVWMVHPVLPE